MQGTNKYFERGMIIFLEKKNSRETAGENAEYDPRIDYMLF